MESDWRVQCSRAGSLKTHLPTILATDDVLHFLYMTGKAGQANSLRNDGVSCHFVLPGVNNTDPIELLRILRIVVLRPLIASGAPAPINREVAGPTPLTRPIAVSFRSVVPEVSRLSETQPGRQMVTRWQTETMKQTFAKASAILQHSSGLDLTVYCVGNKTDI